MEDGKPYRDGGGGRGQRAGAWQPGRGCAGLLKDVRGEEADGWERARRPLSVLVRITYKTGGTGDSSHLCGGWNRPTSTWGSSKIPRSPMVSTRAH